MASSAAPVANAAVAYSTFESLRLGRAAQSVVARLIRFWDSRNINKNGEFMGITILLLDELFPNRRCGGLNTVHAGIRPQEQCSHEQGGGPLLNRTFFACNMTPTYCLKFICSRNVSVCLSLWNEAASTKGPQKF
ncbi:hypothetical protein HID58_043066 [Brassica napus]|uniref:Uncharacterized protein n=1 Tax=Brassica napus TaxID=3708 RepID=A0ABQ8BGV2_BRANA|nr:hypothetical protein HID58_043066 [Brassica napus]